MRAEGNDKPRAEGNDKGIRAEGVHDSEAGESREEEGGEGLGDGSPCAAEGCRAPETEDQQHEHRPEVRGGVVVFVVVVDVGLRADTPREVSKVDE